MPRLNALQPPIELITVMAPGLRQIEHRGITILARKAMALKSRLRPLQIETAAGRVPLAFRPRIGSSDPRQLSDPAARSTAADKSLN